MGIEKSPLELSANEIERVYLRPLNDEVLSTGAHVEENRYRADGPFQRDYARIMYSSSFRRLQGKMQLLSIKNDQFFRNRLTHSLEVAQIARSVACALKYSPSEIFVVEAGALAHDIGNPPFGHAGERVLNEIFKNAGGFEGNAQTLRILTNVEKKRVEFRGLNITYRTLLSVVKYFNQFDAEAYQKQGNKTQKFIYNSDYDMLKKFTQENKITMRTLDVQIVDISDEIAYAAHDLEDGLRIKAYTIDEILQDYQSQFGYTDSFQTLENIVEESKAMAGYGSSHIGSTEYSKLFRQELSSKLINLFLNDIDMLDIKEGLREKTFTRQEKELQFMNYGELAAGLKAIVFKCINNNDRVYSYEQYGKKVLEKLCEVYMANPMYLPPEYRAGELIKQYDDLKLSNAELLQQRLICDYVSGMMILMQFPHMKNSQGINLWADITRRI